MKRFFIVTVVVGWIVTGVFSPIARAESTTLDSIKDATSSTSYSFSYTPAYQFETDLDSGGKFNVQRHFLKFNALHSINRQWKVGLGLSYVFENWGFSDVTRIYGAEPWDKVHRPGLSIPVFYAPDNNWRFGFVPSFEFSGASGAEFDESFIYGAIVSAAYRFSPNLTLGLGAGVFDGLEKVTAFPYLAVDWKINEQFRLMNPFRAGPVGPAGLELVFTPTEKWEFGLGGAYRKFRHRLDDKNALPNGIGEADFLVTFLRAGRKMCSYATVDVAAGYLLNGALTIENENGDKAGSTDFDPAPILALTIRGKF